jgi:hypothetical protein
MYEATVIAELSMRRQPAEPHDINRYQQQLSGSSAAMWQHQLHTMSTVLIIPGGTIKYSS